MNTLLGIMMMVPSASNAIPIHEPPEQVSADIVMVSKINYRHEYETNL